MGNVKIRYYVTHQHPGRPKYGYWAPCLKRRNKKTGKIEPTRMAKAGFKVVDCGIDGPEAWKIAEQWNVRWDAYRRGEVSAPADGPVIYPPCSLGEGFARFKETNTWKGKKKRTREDWERGWKAIAPVFGDVDPRTVDLEQLDDWYATLLGTMSVREAHRAMKIWRALWRVVATIKNPDGAMYCVRDADPSLGIRRKTPKPRNAIWYEGEAVRLVKQAWRMGFRGVACCCAVAWDTMLSPVDVRGLTAAQRAKDANGPLYFVERAKTGKAAIGSVCARTERLVAAYLAGLGIELHDDAPLFRTRTGVPFTKETLAKDFKRVRDTLFPGDHRKLMDFRRSGAVEATAGEVDPAALAGKMANTINSSAELQATYQPHNATLVRLADAARSRGRGRLRGANGPGSKSRNGE